MAMVSSVSLKRTGDLNLALIALPITTIKISNNPSNTVHLPLILPDMYFIQVTDQ